MGVIGEMYRLLTFIIVITIISPINAIGSTISFNGNFVDTSGVRLTKFDPSLGHFNSATFQITDMSFSERFIIDVDDNLGPLVIKDKTREFYFFFTPIAWGLEKIGGYTLNGATTTGDDGDGPNIMDGGSDEIVWQYNLDNISANNIITESMFNDPRHPNIRNILLGYGSVEYHLGIALITSDLSSWRSVEYNSEISYSGNLSVTYDYTPVPLPATFMLLFSGIISLLAIYKKSLTRRFKGPLGMRPIGP